MESTPIIDDTTGETACGKCGMVLEARTEQPHTADNVPFIGNNVSSTKIDGSPRMRNASRMANRVDHSGLTAKSTISSCGAKLGLPSVVRARANSLFHKFRPELRGRSCAVMAAATLYMSCREFSVPRSMAEICAASNVDLKQVRRAYKKICTSYEVSLPAPTSEGFATRLASTVGLSGKTSRKALGVLNRLNESGLAEGKHPVLVAACAVYIAAVEDGAHISQNEISMESGVSAAGMRQLIKNINSARSTMSL